jgi:opacity protein-like surface antigen
MKNYVFTILIILMMMSIAYSQADIGLMGVGGKVGYVMPEDIDNTFGFGLEADMGTIMPNLSLHGFVEYWSKSYDVGFGSDADASISVIALGAAAKYHFEMDGNITPYAGGGLGLNIGKASLEYTDPFTGQKVDDSDSESDIAIHLLGGASMPLSPQMDGYAELKYVISDVEYFGIFLGINYKMGK